MALKKRCIPTALATSAIVTMMASVSAEESPFQAEVFHSVSYQIADLDDEGCGGAMTEYRHVPAESEKKEEKETESEADQKSEQQENTGFIEKVKAFWSRLFG